MIMEKYKEPFPKIVERIDYEKTAAEARLVDERSSVMMETSDPTDEIVCISFLSKRGVKLCDFRAT